MKLLVPYRGTLFRLAVINTVLVGAVAAVLVFFDPSRGFGRGGMKTGTNGTVVASTVGRHETLAPEDRRFVAAAAELAWEQIRWAALGAERAESQAVRTFAREIAARQTVARNDVESLAARKGVLLPTGENVSPAAGALASTTAAGFDDAFVDWAETTQAAAVRLFHQAARDAVDPELRDLAVRMLPHFEAEHERALRLKRAIFR